MKILKYLLIVLFIPYICFGATYTVCSSGCDYTTVAACLSGEDLSSGDNIIEVQENTTENAIFWAAGDSGTSGHPNILQGTSESIVLSANTGQAYVLNWESCNYVTVQNITLSGGTTATIRGANGKTDHTISNVTLKNGGNDGTGANLRLSGGGTNIVVENLTSSEAGQDGAYITGAFTTSSIAINDTGAIALGIRVVDCTGLTISDSAIVNSGGDGIGQYGAISDVTYSAITQSGSATGCGISINDGGTASIYDSNFDDNIEDGVFAGTASTIKAWRTGADGNGSATAGYGDGFTGHLNSTLELYNCTGSGNWNTGVGSTFANSSGKLINCTFYGNGEAKDERNSNIWIDVTSGHWEIKNTITEITTVATRYEIVITANAVGGTATFDFNNNCYGVSDRFSYNEADRTFTQFASDTGGDSNSINTDPLLNTDYSLLSGSPCINTGTNPYSDGDGDQYDFNGNKIWNDTTDAAESAWADGVEIGAYGYFGGNVLMMGM